MPFTTAIPVSETAVGIGIEATRGTGVAPAYWIPTMSPKYKPDVTYLKDESLQGSMVSFYDMIPGMRYDGETWDSYPYLDSFGALLRLTLGSNDNQTGAPSSTTLSSSAAAGASTISTAASIPANSWIVVGSGAGVGTQETHYTTAVTGSGPYTVTLQYPLNFNQASAAVVTGLYQHKFSLLNNSYATGNQPPSATLYDYAGDYWREMTAAQCDGLTISGTADSLTKYTTSFMGNPSIVPSTPTVGYTTAEAPPGWTVTFASGGTQYQNLESWEIALKRNVKPIPTNTGTEGYYQYFAGALDATAKVTVLASTSEPLLTAYQQGTEASFDLTIQDVRQGYACNFHSTNSKFITGEIDRSKEWVEVPLDVQMIPSTNDALAGGVSPIVVSIGNGQTASY